MGPGPASGVVVAASLLLTSCAGGVVGSGPSGSGTVGSGTATARSSTSRPSTTSSASSGSPTSTPPPLLPASGTGAYGYVTAGPTCPVERAHRPCPPRPISETINVRNAGGGTVASTHADSHGRYALDLSPGNYKLMVATATGWPRCPDTPVVVQPGYPTRADISCDTGIR